MAFTAGLALCRVRYVQVRYVQVRYMFVTYMPNSLLTSFYHSKLSSHYEHNLPIPTDDLRELLRLILEENSFKFNEKFFIQTHGCFLCHFMAHLEKRLLMASPSNLWSGRDLMMKYFHCGTFL